MKLELESTHSQSWIEFQNRIFSLEFRLHFRHRLLTWTLDFGTGLWNWTLNWILDSDFVLWTRTWIVTIKCNLWVTHIHHHSHSNTITSFNDFKQPGMQGCKCSHIYSSINIMIFFLSATLPFHHTLYSIALRIGACSHQWN